jgi:TolB-like protein/tetratricopeptide (TPR) repeat protein
VAPTVNSEAVLTQTSRILASLHFSRSEALSRLLKFVVRLTLDGKADELKEYRLGVDVFGRGQDFDPRIDPIVRMQAAKLRARLAEYYGNEGKSDRIKIAIPKGGYTPVFSLESEPAAGPMPEPDVQSIAVLPFVNMSPDPDNEYFSDGLTEELINLLTTVPGLRVVARTSVFCFKNTAADVREIGAKLKVQTVLEGSVRKAGDQLRVTAQLIDVSSGFHLLSRTYPRELKDVFAVQEELANAVVSEIMPQVRGERSAPRLRVYAADLSAYSLYLKGMYALPRSFDGPKESSEIFLQALKIDPNYAPASAGLALTYYYMAWYSLMPPREAMSLGKTAALNAIRIDPSLALAHTILGTIQAAFEWNWKEAEQSFQRAIALQPALARAYQLYSTACLLPQRRVADAIAAIERARALDPFDANVSSTAIYAYSISGNYQAALQAYSLGVEINPKSPLIYRAIGMAHQSEGRFEEAVAACRMACDLSMRAPMALAGLGPSLAWSGDRAGAEAVVQELASRNPPAALPMAMVSVGLGKTDEALLFLEKAMEEREPHLTLVPVHPGFAPLREDVRFHRLLHRMGLVDGDVAYRK